MDTNIFWFKVQSVPIVVELNPMIVVIEREVSPKFVFGQKKYGRRSRPESSEQDDETVEDSDDEDNTADCDTFLPPSPKDSSKTKVILHPQLVVFNVLLEYYSIRILEINQDKLEFVLVYFLINFLRINKL